MGRLWGSLLTERKGGEGGLLEGRDLGHVPASRCPERMSIGAVEMNLACGARGQRGQVCKKTSSWEATLEGASRQAPHGVDI